jgi:hypothetical protein
MDNIWSLVHGRKAALGTLYGLEVEVEGMPATRSLIEQHGGEYGLCSIWKGIRDGSLRNNGVELVFRKGLPPQGLAAAFRQLTDELNRPGNSPSFSHRTSTHVHVNAQDMSVDQVLALVLLAAALEPAFQRYIRPERRTNLFCTPMHMCRTLPHAVESAYRLRTSAPVRALEQLAHVGKYSSVNTGRLLDLGTIEFRSMHGAENLEQIQGWCHALMNLRVVAAGLESVDQVFDVLSSGTEVLLEAVFKDIKLREFPGEPYMSLQSAVAASMSLLTSAKDSVVSTRNEDSLRYSGIRSSDPEGIPNIFEALATDRHWGSTTLQAVRGYLMPPLNLIKAFAGDPTPVGTVVADMVKVAPRTVAFYAINTGARTREYLMRYHVPETVTPVSRETVELRFAVRS